ncbi:MAG: hypothetical protein WBG58_20010 [Ignavibacteriaceae bacterium]
MWEILRKSYRASGFVHLAKTTGPSISISVTYIVLLTKLQKKGKPCQMDLPLLKNDITGSEPTVKMLDK